MAIAELLEEVGLFACEVLGFGDVGIQIVGLLRACGRCEWRQESGREFSACEQHLQIAAAVREGKDADCIAKHPEINAVRKTGQPHTAHIGKADGELKRVPGCALHGLARCVNQPDRDGGVAQMIPERRLLEVAVNKRGA